MFGSFAEASAYLLSLDQLDTPKHAHKHSYAYAAEYGIARARRLLSRLGGARRLVSRCILVAGSKGKGSTVAMLSAVLSAAGHAVGAFTGPHLHTPLERFALYPANTDGSAGAVDMSEIEFIALAEQVRQVVETWDAPDLGEPTRFEAYTAMAYRWFEQRRVDVAVMEIGIGGRLDAVNLAEPLVSIITNISLEHTQMLGNTLAQIAGEKAGILRQHGMGVIAHQSAEAAQAIRATGLPLRFADEAVTLTSLSANVDAEISGQWFTASGFEGKLFLPLLGAHQLQNAAAVLTAVQVLRERGWAIAPEAVRHGLARVRWPGRFEIVWRRPYIVVDGAHTPYSMQRLCEALARYFPSRRVHFILSMLRDKDARSILVTASTLAATLTLTQTQVARAVQAGQLMQLAQDLDLAPSLHVAEDLPAALGHVITQVQAEDVICITGSLHLVAEARQTLDVAEG